MDNFSLTADGLLKRIAGFQHFFRRQTDSNRELGSDTFYAEEETQRFSVRND